MPVEGQREPGAKAARLPGQCSGRRVSGSLLLFPCCSRHGVTVGWMSSSSHQGYLPETGNDLKLAVANC